MGWRRVGLLGLAAMMAVLATAYDHLAVAADVFVPALWSFVFYVVAALLVALAIFPRVRAFYVLAGPLGVLGFASRPCGVLVNYVAGFTRSGWSVVVALIVYSLLAALGGLWWAAKVGPWRGRWVAGATVKGD